MISIKFIPNSLSVIRIFLSLSLILVFSNKKIFILVYLLAGLTDILDGWIARKYNAETKMGARLDSVADLAFYLILTGLFLIDFKSLVLKYLVFIGIIIFIRLLNVMISWVRFKKVSFLHTITNKITGVMVFCVPVFLGLNVMFFGFITLMVAVIAAMEECLILLTAKDLDLNRKGIFSKVNPGQSKG